MSMGKNSKMNHPHDKINHLHDQSNHSLDIINHPHDNMLASFTLNGIVECGHEA